MLEIVRSTGAVVTVLLPLMTGSPGGVVAAEATLPFAPGHEVGYGELAPLKPWFPAPFWAHRDFFFHEGMVLRIGPEYRDYAPPPVYRTANPANASRARIGDDGALLDYGKGLPFPHDEVDCVDEEMKKEAGTRLIWNFQYRWQGFGARARFRYTYLSGGEERAVTYTGSTSAWFLKHRPEPSFEKTGGDVFRGEKRAVAIRFDVEEPVSAAGTRILTFRYESSLGPRATAVPEDTWIYSPEVRRTRKITQTQRSDAVSGTDFTFDDLFSFSGLPPQYEWKCLGRAQVLAPMNRTARGYPYEEKGDFGPRGFSYAADSWELRDAIRLEMLPKDPEHPYSRKVIWLDWQTFEPLYSFAYDRTGALWKIIYHLHRWSEDAMGEIAARTWYPAWEGVPEPRDLRIVSEVIVNVQTGTGNRLEFWDARGNPLPTKKLRTLLDPTRLRR